MLDGSAVPTSAAYLWRPVRRSQCWREDAIRSTQLRGFLEERSLKFHFSDCGKNYKRRGGGEKVLDDKVEQTQQWAGDQGKRNRAFVFRNPMVIVVAFLWIFFFSIWVSV